MDQPSDKEKQPHDAPAPSPEDRQQPDDKPPDDSGEPPKPEANLSQEEHDEGEQEHPFSIGLREVIAGLIVGLILAVAGVLFFHSNGGSSVVDPEPLPLPRIPPTQEAKDEAVPDAKGLVKEKVWAPEATTFSDPFKLEGTGQPIPHNEIVLVSCKIYWPHPESVEDEGYWYRIITKPWKGYFSPANSFWNGDKPGEKPTHSTDFKVRKCNESEMPDG
jgi:hypothetical protein